MIYQTGEIHHLHTVGLFRGRVGRAELYDVHQSHIDLHQSALVYNMDVDYGSEEWDFPKRVIRLLEKPRPNLPVLQAKKGVGRLSSPKKVLLLAIGQVLPDVLQPVGLDPTVAVKIVAQMIRSVASLHDSGLTHGSLALNSWRIQADGSLVLVDFGSLRQTDDAVAQAGFGPVYLECDVQDLARLALELVGRLGSCSHGQLIATLRSATCQGCGGCYPTARGLFDAVAKAAATVGVSHDTLRLSREELGNLVRELTIRELAAICVPSAQL